MRVVVAAALVAVVMMAPTAVAGCGQYSYGYLLPVGIPMILPLGDTYMAEIEQFCWAGPHALPSAEFEFSRAQSELQLELRDIVSDTNVSVFGCLYNTDDSDRLTWTGYGIGGLTKFADNGFNGKAGDLFQIWVPPASIWSEGVLDLHPGTAGTAYLTCD